MTREVVIFSLINWESKLLHRSHMLAKYFDKKGFKVIYIQKENISALADLNLKPNIKKYKRVMVVGLPALPYFKGKISPVYRLNDLIMTKQLKKIFKLFDNPLIIIETPYWIRAVEKSRNSKGTVCYDISDDLSQFATNEKWKNKILEYEDEAIKKSDCIFVTAEELEQKVKENKNTYLVKNGVDLDEFQEAKDVLSNKFKRPKCGFIGGIFEWVNLDLIEKCAKKYPEYDFILIGPTDRAEEIEKLCKNDNIHYLGEKDKDQIGCYFAGLDIGLIPFVSEKTYPRLKTVNSNKVFQYCYFGYPVVSTEFQQVKNLNGMIEVCKNEDEFVEKIGVVLQRDDDKERESRKNFAMENSWERRVDQIISAVYEQETS
ncbi:MAG: hypothetical protein PWQ37_1239 [Candidatus Petromonas sp.]|jgi:glycosyltransferase involved in cell wall biosynthesis|nr:hypothetical protein [Candidatus Petromonas sp.]